MCLRRRKQQCSAWLCLAHRECDDGRDGRLDDRLVGCFSMPIIRPCSLRHAALALLAVRLLASPAYGEEMPGMTMPTEHDGRESKPTKAQPPTTPPSGKSDMPGMAQGKTDRKSTRLNSSHRT